MPAHGFHPASRVNLLTGILAYLSGPIWLLFIAIAVVMILSERTLFSTGLILVRGEYGSWRIEPSTVDSLMAIGLLTVTVLFVLGPEKWLAPPSPCFERREKLGSLAVNVMVEAVLSILMAPSVMLRHSIFVVKLLCGQGVAWKPQQRDSERLRWSEATRAFGLQTVIAALFTATAIPSPTMAHLWLSPVLLGFLLSIPVAVWTGHKPARPAVGAAGRTRPRPAPHPAQDRAVPGGTGDILRARRRRFHHAETDRRPASEPVASVSSSPRTRSDRQGDSVDEHLLTKARQDPESLGRDELSRLFSSETAVRRLHLEHFAVAAPNSAIV